MSTYRGLRVDETKMGLAGFNLARHVHDLPERVEQHRLQLQHDLKLERQPFWLNQTHSTTLLNLPEEANLRSADGSYTRALNWPCVVMTADCLPILFCNTSGSQVAAVHAGWQGLSNGIVSKVVATFADPASILVWMGPAIGPDAFEVGPDVLAAFDIDPSHVPQEFTPVNTKPNKWMGNLYALARKELAGLGVTQVFGGEHCTLSDAEHFYSHRRDPQSGRMASLIWII
ncbi:peptidoglycan editing factor PgeF [Oceanospirillaceae bacterium]|jgi:YfiH family protein|nr:peptidoglycan editing factor PgeF [bacterium]MDB0001337.1 peptidoglycan editing factor PgeF [Oceanospirillaceae bacterium]MDB9904796.1 peptidoglycan editing factor PgeF [Oceanospirillaceae bacterium]MDC0084549.1 peptidoglycan editing factor PgeF [Oceanospirillaceae bacterium]MDC1351852.1 peptidoglycan editing factor PgeF [Oceanospirillaceae bacterium]